MTKPHILCMVALLSVGPVVAQSYPNKSVRLLVPFSPGGGNDFLARILGQKLSEASSQSSSTIVRAAGVSPTISWPKPRPWLHCSSAISGRSRFRPICRSCRTSIRASYRNPASGYHILVIIPVRRLVKADPWQRPAGR